MPKRHDPTGTAGDDTIYGDYNQINTIDGLGGNDYLQGGEKDDIINGGDGNDILVGYIGADQLTGGAGDDTFLYGGWYQSTAFGAQGIDTILDFGNGSDKIDLHYISHETVAGDPTSFVPLTMADITVTSTGVGTSDVRVNIVAGDPSFDMLIHVVGVTPVASDFILA
jgi:Ca2+-binding RTX toxin-like protein